MEDAFCGKATATLEKRASSLKLYLRAAVSAPGRPVPLDEPTVYRYVRALAEECAPASRAQSFVEALRFLVGTWGCKVSLPDVLSARVLGATQASSDRKRLLRQRPPLTASVVGQLEAYLFADADPGDRLVAGLALFLVHARFRFYDAVRLCVEPTVAETGGTGFFECSAVSDHLKSGRTKRRRWASRAGCLAGLGLHSGCASARRKALTRQLTLPSPPLGKPTAVGASRV